MSKIISYEATLNEFLVEVFNDILRLEENSLSRGEHKNLSVSEMHVLEAAEKCTNDDALAGMTDIAARLNVSAGTLTVAVKTLEQKGYLAREKPLKDKRRVCVRLLDKSKAALLSHAAFHSELVRNAANAMSVPEQAALANALKALHSFFKEYQYSNV